MAFPHDATTAHVYLMHVPYDWGGGFVDIEIVEKFLKSGGVGANGRIWYPRYYRHLLSQSMRRIMDAKDKQQLLQEWEELEPYFLKHPEGSRKELLAFAKETVNIPEKIALLHKRGKKSNFNWFYLREKKPIIFDENGRSRIVYKVPKKEYLERFVQPNPSQPIVITPWIIPQQYLVDELKKYGKQNNEQFLEEWNNMTETNIDGKLPLLHKFIEKLERLSGVDQRRQESAAFVKSEFTFRF